MKRPFLLIGFLCLLLILVIVAFAAITRQHALHTTVDINRGFPGTAVPEVKANPPGGSHRPTAPSSPLHAIASADAVEALHIEPDDGFTWLYTLANNAKTSIDLTMYEFVDTAFSAVLVSACARGVRVRVILDQRLEKTRNTAAYTQLNSAGSNCSAAWSNPQFQATHEKAMVLDSKQAVIMTFNLTSRYYADTRDVAITDDDAADVAAIEATFNSDLNPTADRGDQPGAGDALIWSPTSAQADLLGIITGARKTLLVENEELGAASIVDALAAACARGVSVELAMTNTSNRYDSRYSALQQAGCGVHVGANNSSTLYIHAKTIVADLGTSAGIGYVGSINFSVASMTENRELGLYVRNPRILSRLGKTTTRDFTQFPAYQ